MKCGLLSQGEPACECDALARLEPQHSYAHISQYSN